MSIIGSNILAGASGQAGDTGAYEIERSLRFNSSDSAYLSRTPAAAGNRRTWTWAGWVKRSALGVVQEIFAGGAGGTDATQFEIGFASADILFCWSATTEYLNTTQVFRDVGAWYHIVVAFDTTQATANNRLRVYVNGTEVTTFATNNRASLTQNGDFGVNQAALHAIGRRASSASWYLAGYLADIHFIDGQALTPAAFTEVSATTGQLVPKAYTGSFGTNGFHLPFSDNSATTSTTLGKDAAGSNDWTPNNFSVATGAGNDSLVDTPTSYGTDTGAGGEVRGNYATWNPLGGKSTVTLANGNLERTGGTNNKMGTIGMSSGKWYWEIVCTNLSGSAYNGITEYSHEPDAYSLNYMYNDNGTKYIGTTSSSYGASYAVNDVVGFAYDADNGSFVCYKNGVSQGTLVSGLSGKTLFPMTRSDGNSVMICNFGQRPFAYTAPSGFKALCDTNLPAPLVALPNTVMDVKLYTGNGSTQTISGLGFSPDFVWIKERNSAENHQLQDIVRGATNRLFSNLTAAESADAVSLTSFNSDGFSLGSAGNYNGLNDTYVAWTWDAGANSSKTYTVTVASAGGANRYFIDGVQQATINLEEGSTYIFDQSAASNSNHPLRFSTTSNGTHGGGTEYTTGVTTVGTPGNAGAYTQIAVASGAPALYYYCTNHSQMGGAINTNTTAGASNFVGSITSQVRANVSAGFSVVTYTAPSSGAWTTGHGLGVAPQFIITKSRSHTYSWGTYHVSLGNTGRLDLNATNAVTTGQNAAWNNTSPTSTVFSVGSDWAGSGITYVAYCFAPVDGYSSFSSYTGNGSANGPFVYLGFRPAMVMVKMSSSTGNWTILDDKREGYNVDNDPLFPNLTNAEGTTDLIDITSNGFKVRTTDATFNTNAGTYIYAAWASSPFQSSRAR